MGYKIGSFNMMNLGFTALGNNTARNLEKIAEIIRGEQFDIVALQEVLSAGKAFEASDKYIERSILYNLGPNWGFKWAEAESTGGDHRHEGYAFLWNKGTMRMASTILDDGTERTFYPRICRVNHGNMIRKPLYGRFTPQGTYVSVPFEIRLLCVHTYYGDDKALGGRIIREREINTLLQEIYPQISDRVYRSNMPSYTFVLGDYNAELRRPWLDELKRSPIPLSIPDYVIAKNWDDMKVLTVQDQLTTLKAPPREGTEQADTSKNQRYSHNYDHFSYEDSSRYHELNIRCRRVDAVRKYEGDDIDKYRREVSDHLPILMTLNIN